MAIVLALLIGGWVVTVMLGAQAYFTGEQSKPIHESNGRSELLDTLSKTSTGRKANFNNRVPAYGYNALSNKGLSA